MKVCDVVLNSVWYDPRVKKQIEEYIKHGVDLSVVGLSDNRINQEEISKIQCDVNIVDVDPKYYREGRTIFTILKREWLINTRVQTAIEATRPDVIHANDLNALIPAYYAAKKLKCGLIYDSHEIWLENFTLGKVVKAFFSYYERKIVKKLDLFISVSNAAADYFANKYKISRPMVITNCVKKVSDESIAVEKYTGFEVLNHGQFYKGRGYDTMLKAAQLCSTPDITFVIRGRGSMEKELNDYLAFHHVSNARIDPPVRVEELIPMAARAHVGVVITEPICLSFRLTVSNKIFEYAAAGLPIIMSDVPEHRYLNEKYHIGIILKDNSPKCLYEAVKSLYENKNFYCECSQNALRMADELNWENEFSKVIDFENQYCNKMKDGDCR